MADMRKKKATVETWAIELQSLRELVDAASPEGLLVQYL